MKKLLIKSKFLLFISCFPLFTFLLYTACKKQDNNNLPDTASLLQNARSWYATEIVQAEKARPDTNTLKPVTVRKAGLMEKLGKLLKWEDAKLYNLEGKSVVITTVKESLHPFTNKEYEAARCLVFYKDVSGKMQMQVIEMLGQQNKPLGGNIQEIASTAFTNAYFGKSLAMPGVNANILVYDKDYKYEKSYRLSAGNWSKGETKLENTKLPSSRPSLSTAGQRSEDAGCEIHYLVGFHYDVSTGEIVDYAILTSWMECPNNEYQPPYGGDGPNNNTPPKTLCPITKEFAVESLEYFERNSTVEHNTSIHSTGIPTASATGKIREPVVATWDFYTAKFTFFNSATYTMMFPGVRYKNDATDFWKWESLEYEKFKLTKGEVPTCWAVTIDASVSKTVISADEKKATVAMNFSAQLSISCAFGWTVGKAKFYPSQNQDFGADEAY